MASILLSRTSLASSFVLLAALGLSALLPAGCTRAEQPSRPEPVRSEVLGEDGLSEADAQVIQEAEQAVLYSLFPEVELYEGAPEPLPPEDAERFHALPVYGSLELRGEQLQQVRTALFDAVAAREVGTRADCFWPRHGLRFKTPDGGNLDLVICFQCSAMHLTRGGEGSRSTYAGLGGGGTVFDRLLDAAEIPRNKR